MGMYFLPKAVEDTGKAFIKAITDEYQLHAPAASEEDIMAGSLFRLMFLYLQIVGPKSTGTLKAIFRTGLDATKLIQLHPNRPED